MLVSNARLAKQLRKSVGKNTVLFLGAGASRPFGYPTTGELLPLILRSLRRNTFLEKGSPGAGAAKRKLLKKFLEQLLPGKVTRQDNLPLVTALLSILDYSLTTRQSVMAGRPVSQIRQARLLLEHGILEVIDEDDDFSAPQQREFDRFCKLITEIRPRAGDALAIITTNYDMVVDLAACRCAEVGKDGEGDWNADQIGERIDFGFDWLHPNSRTEREYRRPVKPVLKVLKLHGSTNWLRCPLCDRVFINPWYSIWRQAYRNRADSGNTCYCPHTRLESQIVSPSFVRDLRDPNLAGVWQQALDSLRRAERWLIAGYSFPDEDLAVRALFTRAYSSRKVPPSIYVIQQDDRAYRRYDAFFARNQLWYATGGLSDFLKQWPESRALPDREETRRRRTSGRR